MEKERIQLRVEYEEKIRQLELAVEREQESNAKAAAEMENLRQSYQDELQKINTKKVTCTVLKCCRLQFLISYDCNVTQKVELDEEAQETLRR